MMFSTPILFNVFNRPETTAKVAEVIRSINPEIVFIGADGPRHNRAGEAELCRKAREIAARAVGSNGRVVELFEEENLGCRGALSKHVSSFFSAVPEGIIIEDDVLPSRKFFAYAAKMLDFYRNDARVWHINGVNFSGRRPNVFFTRIPHIWGWASWSRAWKHYEVEMADFYRVQHEEIFLNSLPKSGFYRWQLLHLLKSTMEKRPGFDTWDVQWHYALLKHGALAVNPPGNLTCNIGFSGTHQIDAALCQVPFDEISDELSKSEIKLDVEAENLDWRRCYHPTWRTYLRYCWCRCFNYV